MSEVARQHVRSTVVVMRALTMKSFVTALAFSFAVLATPAFAQKQAFYAGKIVTNCDYPMSMSKQLVGSFLEQELFILRILISIDDQVCRQTADFLAANKKPARKVSEAYIRQQYLVHQEQIREAESQD
jgi:hypothetical protein